MTERPLKAVAGEGLGQPRGVAQLPSLASQPFRPGEVPETRIVEVEGDIAALAERRAARAGLPVELWLRIAVETARHIATAAVGRADLLAVLDAAASTPLQLRPLDGHRLRAYADLLRAASPRIAVENVRNRFSLALPESLIAAWSLGAARQSLTVSEYVSTLTAEAPPNSVEYEAASAELGQTLGEWIYREALRIKPR